MGNRGIGAEGLTPAVRILWKDVKERIHARILDSTYAPGAKLPRDEDIAEQLGCVRSTVQRAMRNLSDPGIVERRRKGGTHVRADPITTVKAVTTPGYQLLTQI